jgi:threonine/homoserine/homoserine lactone efflux protein
VTAADMAATSPGRDALALDTIVAMASFAFVSAFTPGPNNIMLTASGANFGFRRTLPHMIGVTLGFLVLMIACAAGIGAVFVSFPSLQFAFKVLSVIYMLALAWKIATAGPTASGADSDARPMTFLQAVAFQWVNPKAVVMALAAYALYVRPGQVWTDFPTLLALFALATVLSVSAWSGFGAALRDHLRQPERARVFNTIMAVLLLGSIVPMLR